MHNLSASLVSIDSAKQTEQLAIQLHDVTYDQISFLQNIGIIGNVGKL